VAPAALVLDDADVCAAVDVHILQRDAGAVLQLDGVRVGARVDGDEVADTRELLHHLHIARQPDPPARAAALNGVLCAGVGRACVVEEDVDGARWRSAHRARAGTPKGDFGQPDDRKDVVCCVLVRHGKHGIELSLHPSGHSGVVDGGDNALSHHRWVIVDCEGAVGRPEPLHIGTVLGTQAGAKAKPEGDPCRLDKQVVGVVQVEDGREVVVARGDGEFRRTPVGSLLYLRRQVRPGCAAHVQQLLLTPDASGLLASRRGSGRA